MPSCAAYRCTNRSEDAKSKGLTFHRFPANDPHRVRQWVSNMRRGRWKPSERSLLCSSHFEAECFDRSGAAVRLRPSAVPTVFPPSVQARKKSLVRKIPKGLAGAPGEVPPTVTPPAAAGLETTPEAGPVSTTKVYDHNYAVIESPRQLKRKVDVLNEQLEIVKKKFKYEKQKSTRLQMKVSRLISLVKSLNDEGFY